jgi:hypothetical protein
MKNSFCVLILFLFSVPVMAQEDSVVAKELISLKYFSEKNSLQYLLLENKLKTGKKIEPLTNKTFHLYLDSIGAVNKIAEVTTDGDGVAKSFLPVGLKEKWNAGSGHKFLAVAAGKEDEVATELEIVKAKISIDTIADGETKSIVVQVSKFENNEWIGAADVEMKVGIQRLGGILAAGDEETYTTDSSGTATVQLMKDSLPGDNKGNIVLAAKVEDNDLYGNLMVEKTVPWGVASAGDKNFFDQRKLWATNFRTPLWLLFMAYSIVIGVWATLIYLVFQIIRIKRIGTTSS